MADIRYDDSDLVTDLGGHDAIRDVLFGRQGILLMRHGPYGVHTEFWDGHAMLQKDMATNHLLGLPRVLFWDCGTSGPAQWLTDYMATQN